MGSVNGGRSPVRWRRGSYLGAIVGGGYWALGATAVLAVPQRWAPFVAISVALVLLGAVLLRAGRSAVATAGLAMLVAAGGGWLALAPVAALGGLAGGTLWGGGP